MVCFGWTKPRYYSPTNPGYYMGKNRSAERVEHTGAGNITSHWLREYEAKKLCYPAYSYHATDGIKYFRLQVDKDKEAG